MAKVDIKKIKDRVTKMNDAWAEGAPDVEFGGEQQADFAADITAAANAEHELADILAQADMKRTEISDRYSRINDKSNNVANGVRGDKNYGEDSALYGGMGFKRKSDRASGLTRKTKNPAK